MTDNDMIDVELVTTNFYTRRLCVTCGGRIEKDTILAQLKGAQLFVCPDCLKAGAKKIDARLREHIAYELEQINFLKTLIGHLRLPTYKAMKARDQIAGDEYTVDYWGGHPNPKEDPEFDRRTFKKAKKRLAATADGRAFLAKVKEDAEKNAWLRSKAAGSQRRARVNF